MYSKQLDKLFLIMGAICLIIIIIGYYKKETITYETLKRPDFNINKKIDDFDKRISDLEKKHADI